MKTALLIACLVLTSCGGTFTLSPNGLSYTTPQILKAPIVAEK